jgi:1,4-alpha-glucan branching enzyme
MPRLGDFDSAIKEAITMATKKTELNGKKGNAQFRQVTLIYPEPNAQSVSVAGDFCNWRTDYYPLKKNKDGVWTTTFTLIPGRYEYRFVVDGEWRNDPNCAERTANEFGTENSVLRV